jgi:hypothetical protein
MQFLTADGYTQHNAVAVHPNGTIIFAVRYNAEGGGNRVQLIVRAREPGGAMRDLRVYREGVDFFGAMGDCHAACLPDGSLVVSLAVGVPGKNVQAAYDIVPGALPAFTPDATYQYPVSATDGEARRLAQEAKEASQRAEQNARRAEQQVERNGRDVEARAKAAIAQAVQDAQRALGSALSADRIAEIAWTKAIQAIYDQAMNDQSPLINRVWSKVQDGIYIAATDDASALSNRVRHTATAALAAAVDDPQSPLMQQLGALVRAKVDEALTARAIV